MKKLFKGSFAIIALLALCLYVLGFALNVVPEPPAQTTNQGGGNTPTPSGQQGTGGNQQNNNQGGGSTGNSSNNNSQGGTTPAASTVGEHGIYYDALDSEVQEGYDKILEGLRNREDSIGLGQLSDSQMLEAYYAVLDDHPEIFWMSSQVQYTDQGIESTLYPEYSLQDSEISDYQAQIDQEVATIMAGIPANADTYDKVKYLYEWIIDNTDYEANGDDQTIVGGLIKHKAVCAGYSETMQYLCHQLAIPCEYVAGTTDRGLHAWNVVQIDGTWTCVDVTWGDPIYYEEDGSTSGGHLNYDYFCVTSEEMNRHRSAEDPLGALPVCDSTEYDYYVRNNASFDTFDQATIDGIIANAIDGGQTNYSFKFTSEQEYLNAYAYYENGIYSTGASTPVAWCSIGKNDSIYIVKIDWGT